MMSDLDRAFCNYGVLKREWDEMNDFAHQFGYTDDEILELHRAAAAVGECGQNHHRNFNALVQIGRPGITRNPDFKHLQRRPSMLSNWLFRLQQLISRWQSRGYRRKRRFERITGQDD